MNTRGELASERAAPPPGPVRIPLLQSGGGGGVVAPARALRGLKQRQGKQKPRGIVPALGPGGIPSGGGSCRRQGMKDERIRRGKSDGEARTPRLRLDRIRSTRWDRLGFPPTRHASLHVPRPLTWWRKLLRRQSGSGEPGWRAAADPTGVPSRFLSSFVSVGEQVAVEALALMSPGCCCCCLLPSPMQEAEAKAGR